MTIMDFVAGAKKGLEMIPLFPEKQKSLRLLNELLAADKLQGAWSQVEVLSVLGNVAMEIGDNLERNRRGPALGCEKPAGVSLPHRIAFPLAVWLLEHTPEVES
jgi:hypothetical protein